MIINGIEVLGELLPLAGIEYAVARVTSIEGDIPDAIREKAYNISDEHIIPRVTTDPRKYGGFDDTPLANARAWYVIVKNLGAADDGTMDFKIIDSIDEFVEPFDLPGDVKNEYTEYFTKARSVSAGVEFIEYELEDAETHEVTKSIGMVDRYEGMYIDAQSKYFSENNSFADPGRILEPQMMSSLKADASSQMLFAEMLDKGVNLYNGLHYMNRADVIAKIIAECTYIGENGVKGPLNFTAVEKLWSNVKDRLLTGGSTAKPVIRRSEQ